MTVRVQAEPFDAGDLLSQFSAGRRQAGGIVSFTGLAREATSGSAVSNLELDAYPGFTEPTIAAMEAEARQRFSVQDVLIVHRYGPIAPGEAIVFVAAAGMAGWLRPERESQDAMFMHAPSSFRDARNASEPGIQRQTRISFLDSGSAPSARPGMTE